MQDLLLDGMYDWGIPEVAEVHGRPFHQLSKKAQQDSRFKWTSELGSGCRRQLMLLLLLGRGR